MNSNEKRRFIEDLTANVRENLINKIPKMPEDWDGLELRELLAEKFTESCLMSQGRANRKQFRRRLNDYRNEVITRNL